MSTRLCIGVCCALAGVLAWADTPVHERATIDSRAKISIENAKGRTTVTAWDENAIEVTGSLGNGVSRFEFSPSVSAVRIEVNNPKRLRGVGDTNLDVKVPRGVNLSIEGVSASIIVTGVSGPVDAESVSGSIRVESDAEYVRAEATSGSIRVAGRIDAIDAESVSGSIRVEGEVNRVNTETVSGGITVAAKTRSVEAETVSGSITMEGVAGEVRAESVSGGIEVKGGGFEDCRLTNCSGGIQWGGRLNNHGELRAGTHSGAVRLHFDEAADASYSLDTFSGGVKVNVPGTGNASSGKNVRFQVGDGAGEVRVETFSGSITVEGR